MNDRNFFKAEYVERFYDGVIRRLISRACILPMISIFFNIFNEQLEFNGDVSSCTSYLLFKYAVRTKFFQSRIVLRGAGRTEGNEYKIVSRIFISKRYVPTMM